MNASHRDLLGGQHADLVDLVLLPRVHQLHNVPCPQLPIHHPEVNNHALQAAVTQGG